MNNTQLVNYYKSVITSLEGVIITYVVAQEQLRGQWHEVENENIALKLEIAALRKQKL